MMHVHVEDDAADLEVRPARRGTAHVPGRLVGELADELLGTVLRLKRIGGQVLEEWQVGVSMSGLAVLSRLRVCGPQRLSAVAQWSHLDPSSASRQISDLADRGLVRRVSDPVDGRARLLELTDKGVAVLTEFESRRDLFFGEVVRTWSCEDVAELRLLLHRLNHDVIEAAGHDMACAPS